MSSPKVLRAWVSFLILSVGCVRTQAVQLGLSQKRPPIPPDQVAIYRTAQQVPRKYEEVALLTSTGDYAMTDEGKMYKSMRDKAAKMGANAIILDSMKEPNNGAKIASAVFGTMANRKGKAIAIYIFPDTTAKK